MVLNLVLPINTDVLALYTQYYFPKFCEKKPKTQAYHLGGIWTPTIANLEQC